MTCPYTRGDTRPQGRASQPFDWKIDNPTAPVKKEKSNKLAIRGLPGSYHKELEEAGSNGNK